MLLDRITNFVFRNDFSAYICTDIFFYIHNVHMADIKISKRNK